MFTIMLKGAPDKNRPDMVKITMIITVPVSTESPRFFQSRARSKLGPRPTTLQASYGKCGCQQRSAVVHRQ